VLSSRLQAAGAHVRAYDPVAEGEARKLIRGVRFAESATEAIDGADAVVLVTEWPEFLELDLGALASAMRGSRNRVCRRNGPGLPNSWPSTLRCGLCCGRQLSRDARDFKRRAHRPRGGTTRTIVARPR